jgi:hypothetical protein
MRIIRLGRNSNKIHIPKTTIVTDPNRYDEIMDILNTTESDLQRFL